MICEEVNMKCIHMKTHVEYAHVNRMHTATLFNQCACGTVLEQYGTNWTILANIKLNSVKFNQIILISGRISHLNKILSFFLSLL